MEETKLDKNNTLTSFENGNWELNRWKQDSEPNLRAMLIVFFANVLIGLWQTFSYFSGTPFFPHFPVNLFFSFILIPKILRTVYLNVSDIDLKIIRFSQNLYGEETAKFCFEPLIADLKKEYSEAIADGQNWKTNWILVRYLYAFVLAIILQTRLGRIIEIILKIEK